MNIYENLWKSMEIQAQRFLVHLLDIFGDVLGAFMFVLLKHFYYLSRVFFESICGAWWWFGTLVVLTKRAFPGSAPSSVPCLEVPAFQIQYVSLCFQGGRK